VSYVLFFLTFVVQTASQNSQRSGLDLNPDFQHALRSGSAVTPRHLEAPMWFQPSPVPASQTGSRPRLSTPELSHVITGTGHGGTYEDSSPTQTSKRQLQNMDGGYRTTPQSPLRRRPQLPPPDFNQTDDNWLDVPGPSGDVKTSFPSTSEVANAPVPVIFRPPARPHSPSPHGRGNSRIRSRSSSSRKPQTAARDQRVEVDETKSSVRDMFASGEGNSGITATVVDGGRERVQAAPSVNGSQGTVIRRSLRRAGSRGKTSAERLKQKESGPLRGESRKQ
jgi:hypothetical protein